MNTYSSNDVYVCRFSDKFAVHLLTLFNMLMKLLKCWPTTIWSPKKRIRLVYSSQHSLQLVPAISNSTMTKSISSSIYFKNEIGFFSFFSLPLSLLSSNSKLEFIKCSFYVSYITVYVIQIRALLYLNCWYLKYGCFFSCSFPFLCLFSISAPNWKKESSKRHSKIFNSIGT